MKIASAWSTEADEIHAVTAAYEMLIEKLPGPPKLILVHSSCEYNNEKMIERLQIMAPGAALQGGTSCLGVMTESGFHGQSGKGLGLLGVFDPSGDYGVGIAEAKGDPEAAVTNALDCALVNAGRPGELPAAVIITSYPGHEENIIRAIENHLGSSVPIIGGTSADNDMSGQWQQFGNNSVYRDAISVAALFPTGDVGYSLHSGYEPTNHRGKATRAKGRVLFEIDGRPAAQVYNEWTNGLIDAVLPQGGSLVPTASFHPIGRPVSRVAGVSYFRLSYPVEVLSDQGLLLFTDIKVGDEVVLMTGTPDSLVSRAERVAGVALDAAPFDAEAIEGAFILFCTGCMLSIQDRMPEVVSGIRKGLKNSPFLGAFTLGEQGCFIGGENRHANLMIAVLVFGPLQVN